MFDKLLKSSHYVCVYAGHYFQNFQASLALVNQSKVFWLAYESMACL